MIYGEKIKINKNSIKNYNNVTKSQTVHSNKLNFTMVINKIDSDILQNNDLQL